MASSTPLAPGHKFLKALVDAFGLHGRAVRRLVIDIKLGDILRLYVEEHVAPERLANLVAELPKLDPQIIFVDRVEVGSGEGAKIVIKEVKQDDSEERAMCQQFLNFWQAANAETKEQIKRVLWQEK